MEFTLLVVPDWILHFIALWITFYSLFSLADFIITRWNERLKRKIDNLKAEEEYVNDLFNAFLGGRDDPEIYGKKPEEIQMEFEQWYESYKILE